MSLPTQLAAKIKSIPMDPLALANNMELAYMLSFENYNISSDSLHCNPKETYNSPLVDYNFVDFDETTYQNLHSETTKNYESKNSSTVKSIRNSFKEFYTRVAAMTYSTVLKKEKVSSAVSTTQLKPPSFEIEYKLDQMRGNNPNDWPRNLKEFHTEINKLPWNAFACEPEVYFEDFFKNSFRVLHSFIKRANGISENRLESIKEIEHVIEIILMVSLKTNNQSFILNQLQTLNEIESLHKLFNEKESRDLVSRLQSLCHEVFEKIPVNEEQEYHIPKRLWDRGSAFMIMKKVHFQRQNGLGYFSVTNDGTYLYIYVSSINGGMYKIGTGRGSSIPGKVYLERDVFFPVGSKLDEVNWVFLKGKLYLKSTSRDPSSIEVINPNTFKTESIIELKANGLFGHQSLVNLNRNSILLTDGQSLYFLGKQIKITKGLEEKKEEEPKVKEEDDPKNKKKKPKKQKNQQSAENQNQPTVAPDQTDKILQFVLYEFDLEEEQENWECDEALAEDLFVSFNNYFTKKECFKALSICDNDLSEAAQWLVDQGEKERTTKILEKKSKVIIAESEITSNFAEKNIKGSTEIITKEGSLLHTQNINELIWTMDEDEITCFSETGFKIFSKFDKDTHEISSMPLLKTTHLKTIESKFAKNPLYSITYDPYNRAFYTFTWPTDGAYYFPTAVLIGSDNKHSAELTFQKKVSVSQFEPKNLTDFSKWVILQMNLVDNTHCADQGRVNEWTWYFAQKIIELNKEINTNNDLDKKKLINKRTKLLAKMNRVHEHDKQYLKDKALFEKNGSIKKEILLLAPFASNGSFENLQKIRSAFGKEIEAEEGYVFIFCLKGWLENYLRIDNGSSMSLLHEIKEELIGLKKHLNLTTIKRMNSLFIEYFHEFFKTSNEQKEFIKSLDTDEINELIDKHHMVKQMSRKSIIYEIKNKEHIIQRYDAKNKLEEVFPSIPNVSLKDVSNESTIGNLLSSSDEDKGKISMSKFLEKQILTSQNGIKLFEYIFLSAFRSIVKERNFEDYSNELESLFLVAFKLLENILSQSNLDLLKNLCNPINEVLHLYFASLCSFEPSTEIIETLLKILEGLQRKDVIELFKYVEDMEFEGISQISERIYETAHPIERGKNQSFPPLKNSEASMIFAEFDKRCQSDPNHDILSIQTTHENSPVGNSINCNDGIFSTNLRLTGKLDSGKPYLILGNSVSIDFSSSGHAKDAKSFGRFGFKFGLRPIFAGKVKYKKNVKNQIEKLFGSKSEFEKYLNTLKFLTITLSNSIENLTHLEKQEEKNKEAQKFLNGKIFKEGYEEDLNLQKLPAKEINKLYIEEELEGETKSKLNVDGRLCLMRILHSESLVKDDKKIVNKVLNKETQSQNLWDLDGIPNYITTYIEKIKTFNGDFVDVFLEARNLALPKGIYANELRKPGFSEEMKKLWLQGEAILFLTVLKHSGLLHLNLIFSIEYIKANLKAFEEARNGIFESFIRRMQSVREWRDLLETYEGKKEIIEENKSIQKKEEDLKVEKANPKTGVQIKKKGMAAKTIKFDNINKDKTLKKEEKKIENKEEDGAQRELDRKKEVEKEIRERLTEDYMIKSICVIKNIDYVKKETFENVTRIINKLEEESSNKVKEDQSVYIEPAHHLIKACLFLLKLKSSRAKEVSSDTELVPEEIYRSYSQDQRHVNEIKVKIFREWLENWKKWKDFKKEGKVELRFPVSEIIEFVNSWISLDKIKAEIELRLRLTHYRIKFYDLNNQLLKSTANSFLTKYILGVEVANIKGSHNSGLESVSSAKMEELSKKYSEYALSLKGEEERKFRELPLKLWQIQELIKNEPENLLEKVKLTSLHLYLIESENPEINLDIAMFFIPFKYINISNQELIFISSLIIQRAFVCKHSLSTILKAIEKEVGNDSLSFKRWRDYFFIERILFLLRKLEYSCKGKIDVEEKQEVAGVLFNLLYHNEVPLISRVCLKILNLLKINFKRDIPTPFDKVYRIINFGETLKIEEYKPNNTERNNPEILAPKCFEAFQKEENNFIKEKVLAPFNCLQNEETSKGETYCIIMNMNQEEDIVWMVNALYYLEEVEKNIPQIKDWEEFSNRKNKKKEHHKENKEKEVQSEPSSALIDKKTKKQLSERLLINIPNKNIALTDEIESTLPSGWFFNYCNVYSELITKQKIEAQVVSSANILIPPAVNQKKGKNTNQVPNPASGRKPWNPVEFLKVYKKFEDLTIKPLEEPKEDEPEENKLEFVKAKNLISRMRKHCADVSLIYTNLSQTGYYVFREELSLEKCEMICQLFYLAGEFRLKNIPCDFKTKDFSTKLNPTIVLPAKKSQIKMTCIKSSELRKFNELINAPCQITTKVENNPLLYYTSLAINELTFEDKCHLPYEEFPEFDSNEENISIEFSKYFTESSMCRMKKRQDEVVLKEYPNLKYFISQGGLESGLSECTLIPAFDQSLTIQKANFNSIYPPSPKHEIIEDSEELLEKAIKLMKTQFQEIKEKNDVVPYILLACYLEKISKINMEFLESSLSKRFAEELYRFVKSFKADNSTESYKEKIQVLITKMLDSENKNLSKFRLYRFDEERIQENIYEFVSNDKLKSSLRQDKGEASQETLESHQYQKSNYKLPIHPPIPEENKLLKYWEKNILPKIYEFVKSSLKQIEIDDFFEQMRIPLRKGDQLEAKKIAYVICDNKLPQGAVLPDSNHNWNSLTIEDVSVGQDILIKLPKSKYECSSPLLYGKEQEYRVGQVMFVDQKNLSVLVRHRLNEYAIFVYSWVPINSLEIVEESLTHYSRQTIFKELEESLKGIIYNHSKTCLTTLSNKTEINLEELIEETILDMFRDNPIAGWREEREWALNSALKNLLAQGSTGFVKKIEEKFCPIRSYDIDLFSESMIKLNKFDNVLGLIVEFKKSSSLIWYSGIRFYADEYGFKEIANSYASRVCVNELEPLEFKNPNVFCKYYSNKEFLKAFEQNKYDQKEILATVFGIDPTWTISTYLANAIGAIALQEKKYEDILTRINFTFLKWLEKRQIIYLSTELCKVITKNTLLIKTISKEKQKPITFESIGTSETQLKSFLNWINTLIENEEKDMLVLYSPLLQNLIEMVASILGSFEKANITSLNIPNSVQEIMNMIELTTEIENSLSGKKSKKVSIKNDTQWERILVIENIPQFISENEFKEKLKMILLKNNGKVLTPAFDIFYQNGKAVILVDSWDITELVEEDIMEKIENEEEKQPEIEGEQELLMEWSCEVCTFINPMGSPFCAACESPAPAPKVEVVYEKIESKDVNKAEEKVREKEMSRFENIKEEVRNYINEAWELECKRIDKEKEEESKAKEEQKKKRQKNSEFVEKVFEKPTNPNLILYSGSSILDKEIVEEFLKNRFLNLPETIQKKCVNSEEQTYLNKFKELANLGYDLWGDNIGNENPALLSLEILSELMQYIQDEICKGSSSVLSYSESSIRMINQIPLLKQGQEEPLNFNAENDVGVKLKYQRLSEEKSYNIRYSWKIIKEINLSASKCLPFINMISMQSSKNKRISSTNSLGCNIKCIRHLIMGALKLELFQKIMQNTSVLLEPQDIPKISLERLKIKHEPTDRKQLISVKDKDDFLFTKAQEQLEKISSINLRPFKPKGTDPFLSFGVTFKGELVQGEAGPYRQFFTDMSGELHPDFGIGMFIKTPNNIHKTGEGRSKWTINPKANSTYYLSLFHFMGRLMGCCVRTGCHLPVDLANFCWKLIADEKIKKSDVDELDRQFFEQNKQLIECPSEETFDFMEEAVGEPVTWVYTTIDGEEQELIPNGKNEKVTYDRRKEYVKKMEQRRVEEIALQVSKIREGLNQMIPEAFLNQISGEELKTMICGVPKVNVELLKKHTKYAGGLSEESPTIKYFWEMMEEISEEERLKIIRFCWGQERLPLNSEEFERNGIRFMIKPMLNKQNPDQALPKADTCFFNIELPQYSSKKIMKERVLLAVNLDNTSINADRNIQPDDNPLMGNVDYEDEEDLEEGGGG